MGGSKLPGWYEKLDKTHNRCGECEKEIKVLKTDV